MNTNQRYMDSDLTVPVHIHPFDTCEAPEGRTCMPTTKEGVFFYPHTNSDYVQNHLRQTECCWGMSNHKHKEKPMIHPNPGIPAGTEIRLPGGNLAVLYEDAQYGYAEDLDDPFVWISYILGGEKYMSPLSTTQVEEMLLCQSCFDTDDQCDGGFTCRVVF